MNTWDLIPLVLLLLFSLAFSLGGAMVTFLLYRARLHRTSRHPELPHHQPLGFSLPENFARRPPCWLVIKNSNPRAVQSALGLHNPKPCSWNEGLAAEENLFIAPPVKGWTLVIGSSLPDPDDDIDACYRFVVGLSRQLGHVQYFHASRVLQSHAWVLADGGQVIRAYAWSGRTLWNQGRRTRAERELGLFCFDYADPSEGASLSRPDVILANVDKVPLLAARWSLDPAAVELQDPAETAGIAGKLSWKY